MVMNRNVKKGIALLLVLVLCMTAFAGCGAAKDEEKAKDEAPTDVAVTAEQEGQQEQDGVASDETAADKKDQQEADKKAEASESAKKAAANGGTNTSASKGSTGPVVLTIKGNGVNGTTTWSMEDLKNLGGQRTEVYSIVNNWPTKKFFSGKGVDVNSVLKAAGMKSGAASFKVIAKDGYYITLTKSQLTGSNHYYPNIKSGSASGAKSVPAILAWVVNEDGTSVSGVKEDGELRLLIGQRGLNDVNTDACVKNVSVIEVSTAGTGSWAAPVPSQSSGTVAAGTGITFNYDNIDKVKIYYTTDGSNPTGGSKVYNPSTTYYQPELTKPIVINENTTLKVLVSGWGKNDSAVQTYTYSVQ